MALLTALIGEAQHVQNNPPKFVPQVRREARGMSSRVCLFLCCKVWWLLACVSSEALLSLLFSCGEERERESVCVCMCVCVCVIKGAEYSSEGLWTLHLVAGVPS